MITGTAALDWLSLTTFHYPLCGRFQGLVERFALGPVEQAKRMQYRGIEADGLFFGEATQDGNWHGLFQASGMAAEMVWPNVNAWPVKCTRLDLQITCRVPGGYSAYHASNAIREWDGPGRPRKVTLIQSGDGLDTVYVGSRSSDRFTRLYVKLDAAGGRWLRFEMEYKGTVAQQAFEKLREDPNPQEAMENALRGEIEAIPSMPAILGEHFKTFLGDGEAERPKGEYKASKGHTLNWLYRQVQPAILRAMRDHDEGPAVRSLVRQWAVQADYVDDVWDDLGYPPE